MKAPRKTTPREGAGLFAVVAADRPLFVAVQRTSGNTHDNVIGPKIYRVFSEISRDSPGP
jgi:hypothetical protein